MKDTAEFCPACGTQLTSDQNTNGRKPVERKKKTAILVAVIVLILALASVGIFLKSQASEMNIPGETEELSPSTAILLEPLLGGKSLELTFSDTEDQWETTLTLHSDGFFEGECYGELKDDIAINTFSGQFSSVEKLDNYTYQLGGLRYTTYETKSAWEENGVHYIATEPYGIEGIEEFILCLPGKMISELPVDIRELVQEESLLSTTQLLDFILYKTGDRVLFKPIFEKDRSNTIHLNLASGSSSGTYYGFSSAVSNILNRKLPDILHIYVQSTGASCVNVDLIDTGATELGIVQNDVMYYAATATDMYEGDVPIKSYSAVMSLYPEYVHIIANKEITSIEQLRGKRVSVGDRNAGTKLNADHILMAYGIDTERDISEENLEFVDSLEALKNGTIDAAFVVAGYPTTAISDLADTFDFNLLEIDQMHADILMENHEFYTYRAIPANTYCCVDDDVFTVAVMATLVARNSVSEDVVYEIIKGIFDNQTLIEREHIKGAELSLTTAQQGIAIPFHPGAQKYFNEVMG